MKGGGNKAKSVQCGWSSSCICTAWGGRLEGWKEIKKTKGSFRCMDPTGRWRYVHLNPLSALKNFSIYFQTFPAPLKSCQSKLSGKIYRECLCHSSALEIKLISNQTGWKARFLTCRHVCYVVGKDFRQTSICTCATFPDTGEWRGRG